MFIKRRVAAAVALALALAFAFGGIVGSSRHGTDSPSSETTDQAGGTWS